MRNGNAGFEEGVSRRLADMLARTTYADLPVSIIAETERSILDWLGSALSGAIEPPARFVQQVVAHFGASNESTMFASGRSSAAGAALANGVASHILELDDVHKTSTLHPGAPIIPAALAVAEREHLDGPSFLLAVALGYEAALRIGEAVNPSHYRFWHPTGTVGTFGSAAAAGSLLKLDSAQMLDALGTAGTQAAGLWEFNADGAMSKHLHPGKAAFNGILAADLARLGFTGARQILEGQRGFFRAMSDSHDATRIDDGLGTVWKISENCYKLHSCCGHTHTAVDIALKLRSQANWSGAEILEKVRNIHIETYGPGYAIVKELNPCSSYQAKFSIAYCVASGLVEGLVGLDQFASNRFTADGVRDLTIAALLPRIKVTVENDLTAKYPAAWPARLTLTLADGSTLTGAADYPEGNPEFPLSDVQLENKFLTMVAPRFGKATADAALMAVRSLRSCTDMSRAFGDVSLPQS